MAFPKSQPEINDLLQLWLLRIDNHAAQYNLTKTQTDQIKDDATMYNLLLSAGGQLEADRDEFYVYKGNMNEGVDTGKIADYPTVTLPALPAPIGSYKYGIEKRNQELYNFLKGHPNRSEESLADLGIKSATGEAISPEDLKPALSGAACVGDGATITFNKQGQPICRIQMRRGGGEEFTTVGDVDASPFIDETASVGGKPEKREYRGIYIKNNKPVGQYSNIIVIYTTP